MPLPLRIPAKPVIAKLSPRHEALALFVVAHPHLTQGQVAKACNYTQAWVSQVMSTSMFKARVKYLQEQLATEILETLGQKIARGAELAIDRTIERLEDKSVPASFLASARQDLLKALDYGAPPSEPSKVEKHLHVHVSAEDVARARARIGQTKTAAKLLPDTSPQQGEIVGHSERGSKPPQQLEEGEDIREDRSGLLIREFLE